MMAGRILAVCTYEELIAHLAEEPSAKWSVMAAPSWPLEVLDRIEEVHPGRRVDGERTVHDDCLGADVSDLFDAATRHDPLGVLSVSAGVPLSIPDWNEIEKLLRLRRQAFETSTLFVLVSQDSRDNELMSVLTGCLPMPKRGWSGRLLWRLGRTLLRRLFCRRVSSDQVGRYCWVSVGSFLKAQEPDTFYGRWPWRVSRPPLRIYQEGGRAVRLTSDSEQIPLEALISYSDILGALGDLRIAVGVCRRLSEKDFNQRVLLWLWFDEIRRGEVLMLALQKRAWNRLFVEYKPRLVVFPYEARAWERSLVRQARSLGISSIGYQHSSLTPRHHALLVAPTRGIPDWIPDRIICCGEITARRLATAAPIYRDRLHVGVALRTNATPPASVGPAILVALSSSRYEAAALFRFFALACRLGLRFPLIFRPHPTIPVLDLYEQWNWPATTRLSDSRSLNQDLSEAWCVAYSSATVCLEGMRYGRIPLYIDIGEILSGDPLDEGLPFKLRASSPESLIHSLSTYLDSSQTDLPQSVDAARYAQSYLIEPTDEGIATMSRVLES